MKFMACLTLCMASFLASSESLKIGLQPYDPPFSIQVGKNNLFSGFEAQLIADICKRLHANCTYIPMQFHDFFPQLIAQNIDLALGQISITKERSRQFSFSIPYMISSGQLIIKNNSPITRAEELRGKKVGVFKASLYKEYLWKKFDKDIVILEYDSSPSALQALITDEVDAVLLSTIAEKYWVINNKLDMSDFHFIGNPIFLGNGSGIMAHLDSYELIHKINQIIIEMETDGTYLQLYNLYFGLVDSSSK